MALGVRPGNGSSGITAWGGSSQGVQGPAEQVTAKGFFCLCAFFWKAVHGLFSSDSQSVWFRLQAAGSSEPVLPRLPPACLSSAGLEAVALAILGTLKNCIFLGPTLTC